VQAAKDLRRARVIGPGSGRREGKKSHGSRRRRRDHLHQTDFETEVKRLTNNAGVDVVYDSVEKTPSDKSPNCPSKRRGYSGSVWLILRSAVPPLDPQVLKCKGSRFI